MNDLGEKLKNLRIGMNLTQTELGDKIGVSDKTISSWENSRTMPDVNMLFILANIFDVSFYSLFYNDYCNKTGEEIEIKLKLEKENFVKLMEKFNNKALFLGIEKQSATYYEPEYRRFNNEYLRIRSENGKYLLNYKNKINNMKAIEYETMIDDKDSLNDILVSLGMKKIGVINKKRSKYLYQEKYEIDFDEVEGIGLFMEIEIKKREGDETKEFDKIFQILHDLNVDLNCIDTKHYPDYLRKEI